MVAVPAKVPTSEVPCAAAVIFNPLPRALRHYQAALIGALASIELVSTTANFEIGSRHTRFARLSAAIRPTTILLRAAINGGVHVVIWPAFGLADIAIWRLGVRRAPRLVVVHDPVPLRAQLGYGGVARRLAAWASKNPDMHVVTHTQLAARELARHGITVRHVLPHPLLARAVNRPTTKQETTVLVAGQYKSARDVRLLQNIASAADTSWSLQIAGRGWSHLPGWLVEDRFLPEGELDRKLSTASVVLIPYEFFFQSGIATRAFELGVPVVGRRHEFLESLYGADWPGLVDSRGIAAWIAAVERAKAAPVPSAQSAAAGAARAWTEVVQTMIAPSGN